MDFDNGPVWEENYYRVGRTESKRLYTAYERSLYTAMCELAYGGHFVNASQQTMANTAGMSLRKVSPLLNKLEDRGLIRRANDEEKMRYQRKQGYKLKTELWKLLNLATEDTKPQTLYEQATGAATKATAAGEDTHKQQQRVAYAFTNYWNNHSEQHKKMPAFLMLLKKIPAERDQIAELAEAVNTALAKPRNNPFGYLVHVLNKRLQTLSNTADAQPTQPPSRPAYDPRIEWGLDDDE